MAPFDLEPVSSAGLIGCSTCGVVSRRLPTQMFTVTADALLKSVGAADTNEDAGLGQVIDFFATEPQPARELFARNKVAFGEGHFAN